MKAVGFNQNHSVDHPHALQDVELPVPDLRDHDLLVEVQAVSVNPVDTKIRAKGDIPAGQPRIVGWDAAGIVRAAGPLVTRFKPGDHVWYAGDITRPGCNSELHAVDERIVGPMPTTLDFAEAASLMGASISRAWHPARDSCCWPKRQRPLRATDRSGITPRRQVRAYRRSSGLRHWSVQRKIDFDPLGADVHPGDLHDSHDHATACAIAARG
jgi:D-arabinose 1-dehydrogenase-like Zn-dependent alcohol dehydrogenase